MLTGSLDLTKVSKLKKEGKFKSAFFTNKNGTKLNLTVWVNDDPDEYGNDAAITIYDKETKEKMYLGNLKHFKKDGANVSNDTETNNDDLPF